MAKILILGGTGFIGRHLAAALYARGHAVVIGTRRPHSAARRLPPALAALPTSEVHLDWLLTSAEWKRRLAGIDVVVNAVGILRERGHATYERVHHLGPAALAGACALLGIRLIHVSALGLDPHAYSRFISSKARGEAAIASSGADYLLVRPSLLDGEGGFGARWMRSVSRWPIHFVPGNATGRIAALQVEDLAKAIAALCEPPVALASRIVELGGSDARTLEELLAALRALHRSDRSLRVSVPALLAVLASFLCDLARFSPFSFGHLELLGRDNVPRENLLPALLGRRPAPVGAPVGAIRPAAAPGLLEGAGPAS
jgi:NADH dehydrogenase